MKISILLPYKENFSPEYPGAVSLFVYETTKNSKFKKDITVFGNTEYKRKFDLKYKNIYLKKSIFTSQTRNYVKKFIDIEKKNKIIAGIQNGQPEYAEKMIKKGFQLVTIGSDQRYMTAASKTALGKLKKDEKKDTGKGY